MVRADVVKDARDRSAHAVIEPLGRVGVNGATCILAFAVPDSIVVREGFTDGHERLPFIAHQMGRLVDGFTQRPGCLARGCHAFFTPLAGRTPDVSSSTCSGRPSRRSRKKRYAGLAHSMRSRPDQRPSPLEPGTPVCKTGGMIDPVTSTSPLLVILNPDYGERLREVWPKRPVWIGMSSANEPAIRSLWATRSPLDPMLTGFRFDAGIAPEDSFLAELDAIDLHHGPHSTSTPYTELEVIGAPLTAGIRRALSQIGFTEFDANQNGFIAQRSQEAASRLRV